jgi:hypothetical protein
MEGFMLYVLVVNVLNSIIFRKRLKKLDKLYWLQLIPLAIGAVSAIAQANQAKKQREQAKKALDYKNPYVDSAADTARAQANSTRYAGQDQDESNVRQGVADTFSNISRSTKSSGDILNAAARLSGQQQKAYQDIGKSAQIFRQGATDRYRQAQMQQAGVADQNRSYSENLQGAASKNEYNGWNSLLGGVAAAATWGNRTQQWGYGTPGYSPNYNGGYSPSSGSYNWGF